MSVFKRKDAPEAEEHTSEEKFARILSGMTVDQEVEIREIAFRHWMLIGIHTREAIYEQVEVCDAYLRGYLNGLVDSGIITIAESSEIRTYIKTHRFKDLVCDRVVSEKRKEEDNDESRKS